MKIKEVSAGIKISKNYDSYQANLVAELEVGENPEDIGKVLMEKASKIVDEKLKETNFSNKTSSGEEVGAAWPHKKSPNFLSVKFLGSQEWEDIRIKNLEKIKEGYKWKKSEGTFIFKKIPEEKRRNSKMPKFRIYKSEEKDE